MYFIVNLTFKQQLCQIVQLTFNKFQKLHKIDYNCLIEQQMGQFTPPPRTHTGFGKVVSLLNFIALFTVLPEGLKLIWPTLLKLPDLGLYILIVIGCNFLILGIYNLVMIYIYTAKIPFFQKYRNNNKPWPWESDPQKWKQTLKKTMFTVCLNLFVFSSLLPTFQYVTGGMLYEKSLEAWPSRVTMIWQFFFFMLFQDVLFYWSHSSLHHPKLYWIHKKHHEYNIAVTIAATYAHPLQYIFGNAIPTGLGYHLLVKVTSVHYVTMIAWLVFRLFETCQGHSGYDWSWGQMSFIPWKLGPDYHDFHHSHNVGNYGSMFGFWDTYMKTNRQYRKFKLKNL